jgi:hypothetical protein
VTARFFVDENDLAIGGHSTSAAATSCTPGHADLADVPRGSLDDEWLPVIAAHQLVVISRDQRIRYRPAEKLLWVRHGVRGFVLTGRKSQSTADSLTVLEHHWTSIEATIATRNAGPWMYAVTVSGLREIPLS